MKTKPQVRVGIGVFVYKRIGEHRRFLMGLRKGSHGAGEWSLPGGHLEFKESMEHCAKREVMEEAGVRIKNIFPLDYYTNDIFEKENKHYITIYFGADYAGGKVRIMEPDKCDKWEWFTWDKLPYPIFLPIQNLKKQWEH
jgi:8-oxo-dGTP diphosphatase